MKDEGKRLGYGVSRLDHEAYRQSAKPFSDGIGMKTTPLYGPGEFGDDLGAAFLGTYLSCNGGRLVDVWMYHEVECEGWPRSIRFGIQMSARPGHYATLSYGELGIRELSQWVTPMTYRPTYLHGHYPDHGATSTEFLANSSSYGNDEHVLPSLFDGVGS
jgi:hypothetical protein